MRVEDSKSYGILKERTDIVNPNRCMNPLAAKHYVLTSASAPNAWRRKVVTSRTQMAKRKIHQEDDDESGKIQGEDDNESGFVLISVEQGN